MRAGGRLKYSVRNSPFVARALALSPRLQLNTRFLEYKPAGLEYRPGLE